MGKKVKVSKKKYKKMKKAYDYIMSDGFKNQSSYVQDYKIKKWINFMDENRGNTIEDLIKAVKVLIYYDIK